jgi:hypothetical protein
MADNYEVLSPWAEVDPVPLQGIAPRVSDLKGKKIGLFSMTYKKSSTPMLAVVEKRLKERYPTAEFKWFEDPFSLVIADMERASDNFYITPEMKGNFEDWVKGVDAVVGAVGD